MDLPTNAKTLIDNDLWVVSEEDGQKLTFSFYCFHSSSIGGTDIKVDLVMHGTGYTGLQECRHTYWGEDGYLNYPIGNHIKAILYWLEQHFDLT